jgi:hypothetical protein
MQNEECKMKNAKRLEPSAHAPAANAALPWGLGHVSLYILQFAICIFHFAFFVLHFVPSRRRARSLGCCILLLAAAVLQGGCSGFPQSLSFWREEKSTSQAKPVAGPTQVHAGGDGFNLGDVEQPALSPQQFTERIGETLRTKNQAAASRIVQLYPDVALAVLRDPAGVSPEVLSVIALAHDQQCTLAGSGASWTALVQDRLREPQRYAPYDTRRREFMTQIQNGHVQEALGKGLAAPQGAAGAMLSIDCQYLTGIALVLANRPQDAVGPFQNAVQAARGVDAYQTTNLLLLLSDAVRRAGDNSSAESIWREAAQTAADLAGATPAVTDPILWERAAYLRPVGLPFPCPRPICRPRRPSP